VRLSVNYRTESNDTSSTTYQAKTRMIPGADGSPHHIADAIDRLSVDALAQKWFVVNIGGEHVDDNAALCGDLKDVLAQKPLREFYERVVLSSSDPIALAAAVERLKRACSFAAHATNYDAMFEFRHEEVEDVTRYDRRLSAGRPNPLPVVPDKVIQYVTNG
jgi:hypothetical protein